MFKLFWCVWTLKRAGSLNALLPCGLVYVALSGALIKANLLDGFFYMVFFGSGTIPMLVVVRLIGTPFKQLLSRSLQYALPLIIMLYGAWMLARGLGLGIPYLSPEPSQMELIINNFKACE